MSETDFQILIFYFLSISYGMLSGLIYLMVLRLMKFKRTE